MRLYKATDITGCAHYVIAHGIRSATAKAVKHLETLPNRPYLKDNGWLLSVELVCQNDSLVP